MAKNQCTFCGDYGHNRRTCSKLKKRIQDEPDGYYARVAKRQAEKAIANPRRCGYCRGVGHNKKTCDELRRDRSQIAVAAKEWRIKFLECAKRAGFGAGTLMKFRDLADIKNSYERSRIENQIKKHGSYGIVIKFDYSSLDHRQKKGQRRCMLVRFPNGKQYFYPLPVEFSDLVGDDGFEGNAVLKIVGTVKTCELEKQFSPEWHEGWDSANALVK